MCGARNFLLCYHILGGLHYFDLSTCTINMQILNVWKTIRFVLRSTWDVHTDGCKMVNFESLRLYYNYVVCLPIAIFGFLYSSEYLLFKSMVVLFSSLSFILPIKYRLDLHKTYLA